MSSHISLNYSEVVKSFSGTEAIITPEELKNVFSYIKNAEESIAQLSKNLDSLNSKLNNSSFVSETHSQYIKEIQYNLNIDFSENKGPELRGITDILAELKDNLVQKFDEIKQCVWEKSLEALDGVFKELHIKEICEKISELIQKIIEKIKDYIERITYIENELSQAKEHVKNAFDPTMPSSTKDESNVSFMPVKSFMNNQRKVLLGIKERTDTIVKNLEDLSQKVELNLDKKEDIKKELFGRSIQLTAQDKTISIAIQR